MKTILSAVLVSLVVGCSQPTTRTEDSADADHGHEHSHGIAAHRPRNIALATKSLEQYRRRLASGKLVAEARKREAGELLDVVRWLPEIAADSDMSEADWTRIHAESQALEPPLRQFAEGTTSDFRPIDEALRVATNHLTVILSKGEWNVNEPFEAEVPERDQHHHDD